MVKGLIGILDKDTSRRLSVPQGMTLLIKLAAGQVRILKEHRLIVQLSEQVCSPDCHSQQPHRLPRWRHSRLRHSQCWQLRHKPPAAHHSHQWHCLARSQSDHTCKGLIVGSKVCYQRNRD